jgi:hypothetical protein
MSNKNAFLASLFAMGAAMGLPGADAEVRRYRDDRNDFQKFHDSMRSTCKRGFVFYRGAKPYVKPIAPGEVKGKLPRKAAKRQRMAALRAAREVSIEQGAEYS